MLSRTLRAAPRRLPALRSAYSTTPDNPIPANDPKGRHPRSPVSATNATPTSSEGSQDKVLQESVEQGEELRTMQSPNRKGIWSRSQQPRERAMVGPRFEQTIMADQVRAGIKDENTD
jgi:NADH dehydrogenase (ubiquinone) Fe-S protein 6